MNAPRFFRTFFIILGLLLLLVLLHSLGTFRFIEKPLVAILHRGTATLYTVHVWTGHDNVVETMTSSELEAAYLALSETYQKQTVDKARLAILEEEVENLKAQVQFFSDTNWQYVTGRITGKQLDPFESTVTLYIEGADTLIPLGVPAVTGEGIFVGTVIAVEGDIVTVRLLTDSRTKVGAGLLTKDHTIGVVEGGFGKSTRMNFIPQNETVSAGDIVVTSGLTPEIPYGLPIGTIEVVEKEPYEPFQSAILSPLVSPNSLQVISIIIDSHS